MSENTRTRNDLSFVKFLGESWLLRYTYLKEHGSPSAHDATPSNRCASFQKSPTTSVATDESYPPSIWCVSQEWFGQRQALLVERAKLEEETWHLEETRQMLETKAASLECTREKLRRLRRLIFTGIERHRSELGEWREKLEQDRLDRDKEGHRLEEQRREIEGLLAELDRREQHIENRRREIDTSEQELCSKETKRAELERQLTTTCEKLEASEKDLQETYKVKQQLMDDIATLESKIEKGSLRVELMRFNVQQMQDDVKRWFAGWKEFHPLKEWATTAPIHCPYCLFYESPVGSRMRPQAISLAHEKQLRLFDELMDLKELGHTTPSAIRSYWKEAKKREDFYPRAAHLFRTQHLREF